MKDKEQRLRKSYDNYDTMDDSFSRKARMFGDLDPDLKEFFDDIRLVKKKKTTKKKKKKANFAVGDQVEIRGVFGTIIYGPYSSENGKDSYEIETEEGGITTAEDDGSSIQMYIPPVEETEEDDIF